MRSSSPATSCWSRSAFVGLTAFGVFFDIFAALGFVSLCFGLCRMYAAAQRGRAIGNDDYRAAIRPDRDRWLAMARLRFVPDAALDDRALARRMREYRRRLRRFLYRGTDAVAIEGIVEYKSWLWEALDDVNVLMWGGPDRATRRGHGRARTACVARTPDRARRRAARRRQRARGQPDQRRSTATNETDRGDARTRHAQCSGGCLQPATNGRCRRTMRSRPTNTGAADRRSRPAERAVLATQRGPRRARCVALATPRFRWRTTAPPGVRIVRMPACRSAPCSPWRWWPRARGPAPPTAAGRSSTRPSVDVHGGPISPRRRWPRSSATRRERRRPAGPVVPRRVAGGQGRLRARQRRAHGVRGKETRRADVAGAVRRQGRQGPGQRNRGRARPRRKRPERRPASMPRNWRRWSRIASAPQQAAAKAPRARAGATRTVRVRHRSQARRSRRQGRREPGREARRACRRRAACCRGRRRRRAPAIRRSAPRTPPCASPSEELTEEELALGPEIAGRILGAAPLWKNDAAQRRVNRIGRWMASHTRRPELPGPSA